MIGLRNRFLGGPIDAGKIRPDSPGFSTNRSRFLDSKSTVADLDDPERPFAVRPSVLNAMPGPGAEFLCQVHRPAAHVWRSGADHVSTDIPESSVRPKIRTIRFEPSVLMKNPDQGTTGFRMTEPGPDQSRVNRRTQPPPQPTAEDEEGECGDGESAAADDWARREEEAGEQKIRKEERGKPDHLDDDAAAVDGACSTSSRADWIRISPVISPSDVRETYS